MIYLAIGIVSVLFISFAVVGLKQASNVFNSAKYWAEREQKWSGKKE
jgi:hypothetical protein